MLKTNNAVNKNMLFACMLTVALMSCTPGPQLTMSWHRDGDYIPATAKFLVLSVGKDPVKRKTGENALTTSLRSLGFAASSGFDSYGEVFPAGLDSLTTYREIASKGFDYVLTLRVLNINENNHWVTDRGTYTYPGYLYRGFYRYYKVYGLYPGAAFMSSGVKVILESNIYQVSTGELIWSGQSMAFRRAPTARAAKRYAANIMHDLTVKKLITNK